MRSKILYASCYDGHVTLLEGSPRNGGGRRIAEVMLVGTWVGKTLLQLFVGDRAGAVITKLACSSSVVLHEAHRAMNHLTPGSSIC
jgi:hypothetical protein